MKCAHFKAQNTVIHCAYGFIPACAQVGKLSPLYFNLRHFSNRSSNRLQRTCESHKFSSVSVCHTAHCS